MKIECPILFSGPMVRAILDGRKTQTRRVIKPQPPFGCGYEINGANSHALCRSIDRPEVWVAPTARSKDHRLPCHYGQPGDRLWVRETFHPNLVLPIEDRPAGDFIYRADQTNGVSTYSAQWKPSIHMPRLASRITLEIIGVRIERVQEISEEDAEAEGLDAVHSDMGVVSAREHYKELWDNLNAKRGFGWDENPWIWVLEFRRVA